MPLFQPFVYEGENFVQSDTVYLTDVAVLLNRTEKKLYLWAGRRATKDAIADAQRAWTKFIEKYSDFKSINLITKKDLTDFELAKEIRTLLGLHAEEELAEKAKTSYTFVAKISSRLGIFFLAIILLLAAIILLLPVQGDIILISETSFTGFFDASLVLIYISEGLFIASFFLALLGKNSGLATPSVLAIIVNIGFWLYLSQRDFLFYFQNYGATPGIWQLLTVDALIFIGIIALVVIGICLIFLIGARSRHNPKATEKQQSPAEQVAAPEIPFSKSK